MFDFSKFLKDIALLKTQEDFSKFLESCYAELEDFFNSLSNESINNIKFDIEELLYDLLERKIIQEKNTQTINAFLLLLSDKFMQFSLIGATTIIYPYVPKGATKIRLEATKLYLRVNDISKDYLNRCDEILTLLESSAKIDEYNTKAIKSFLYFYHSAIIQFQRVNGITFAKSLTNFLAKNKQNYTFLQDSAISSFLSSLDNLGLQEIAQKVNEQLAVINVKKSVCQIDDDTVQKENSEYSKALYSLPKADFTAIRNISYQYIKSIGDPIELYDNLLRGEKIIDDEKLLYKYLVSFGVKHKDKLYSSFEVIIQKLQDEKFDIVDWGCGQGTATMLLLNYANKQNINLDIENITLIEPSSLALSRALLHIDILKQKHYNLKAINSDLDCLNENDIETKSTNKTLHLFSNILDIEGFTLDKQFFKKVSHSYNGNALFVCVSPYRSDKNNNRLNLFYKHFDENYDTELISSRDSDIGNSTRYEKIFEVSKTAVEIIEEKRQEIEVLKKGHYLNVMDELSNYSDYVVPILNLKILEDSISADPEYAIIKIRKVAEVITSKIYSTYEENAKQVSFNDKIRYLSYEKKVFDKTITNYVQTLRTIGNSGVHEDGRDISRLKLDAHLMVIALISFLQEVVDKNLIEKA